MFRLLFVSLMLIISVSSFAQGKINRNSQKTKSAKVTNTSTSSVSGKINGHEYVDLGLPSGLKWATCNVGASKPSGYGDYFAWGETSPKSKYSWETYFDYDYEDGSKIHFKNYENRSKKELESRHDVARLKWGGTWRIPTYAEMKELKDNCTWKCTVSSGVSGWKITGPSGKSIFLPFAGMKDESNKAADRRETANQWGFYWTSTLDDYDHTFGTAGSIAGYWRGVSGSIGSRYIGASIRPVSN